MDSDPQRVESGTIGASPEPPPEIATAQAEAGTKDADRALINQFRDQVKVPGWLVEAYAQAARDRKYLSTDIFAEDDPLRASCNDLLRSIYAKLALVWPKDPEPVCKPPKQVEPDWSDAEPDPLTGLMIEPVTGQPVELAKKAWERATKLRERAAKTTDILLEMFATEAAMAPVLRRAALEAMTVGLAWVKVGWMEDPTKDSLARRQTRPDGLDQAAKLRQLLADYHAGTFEESDARWREIQDLKEYVGLRANSLARYTRDQRWLLLSTNPEAVEAQDIPEPERWQGGTLDLVAMENLRLDWYRIGCLEKLSDSRWIHERIWMTRAEVARKFTLTDEEKQKLGNPAQQGQDKRVPTATNGQTDPDDIDLEATTRGEDEIAVWETRYFENGRTYWWTEGIDRFLRDEIPEVIPCDGIVYVPIYFNPVAGQFLPLSDVQLGHKLQDEINDCLTDDREARIARYPWYVADKGAFSPEDKQAIGGRQPHLLVELTSKGVEAAKALHRVEGSEYEPALYQIGLQNARANLERQLGVPSEALQGTGDQKFAKGIEVAADNMNAQAARAASSIQDGMRQIFRIWRDYALALMPTENVKKIAGIFAVWPEEDIETISRGMVVDVVSAGNRGQRRQDLEDAGRAVDAILGLLRAKAAAVAAGKDLDVVPFLQRIQTALDLRIPVESVLKDLPMPAMAPGMPLPSSDGRAGPMPGTPAPNPLPGPAQPPVPGMPPQGTPQ